MVRERRRNKKRAQLSGRLNHQWFKTYPPIIYIYLALSLSLHYMHIYIYIFIYLFMYIITCVYIYVCVYIYIHYVSSESRLKSSQALLSEWLIAGVCAQFEASWGLDLLGFKQVKEPGSHDRFPPGCFLPNRWETMDLTIQRWRFMRWTKKNITWTDGMELHGKNGNVKMPFGLTNKRWLRLGLPLFIGSSNPHEANKAWQHNTIWIEYNQIIWSHKPLQPSMAWVRMGHGRPSQDVNCSEVGKNITKHHMAKRKTEAT